MKMRIVTATVQPQSSINRSHGSCIYGEVMQGAAVELGGVTGTHNHIDFHGERLDNEANHNRRNHSTNTAWYNTATLPSESVVCLSDRAVALLV